MIKIGELLRKLWSLRSCFLILPPGTLATQGIKGAMKRDVSKHWCTLQWCASRGWVIAHENWTSCACLSTIMARRRFSNQNNLEACYDAKPPFQLFSLTDKSQTQGSFIDLVWWRHQMETFSALLAIHAGNSPVPGEFPTQRPATRSFDVFFDLRLNKRLSKQSWGWRFETLSRPLWRHSNGQSLTDILDFFIMVKWRELLYRYSSTLVQVMACCLTAPSHNLNKCWPVVNRALGT